MPRVQITHNHIVSRRDPNVEEGIPAAVVSTEIPRRNVHVSWDKSGWVQLGIDVSLAELRQMVEHVEVEAKAAKAGNAAFGEYDMEAHQFRIVSDVLTRRECNDLINTSRNARDRAYGKDA